jgi:hypothetical protein
MHLILYNSLLQKLVEFELEANRSISLTKELSPGIYFLRGFDSARILNYKIAVEK